jgi:hypothetical protein
MEGPGEDVDYDDLEAMLGPTTSAAPDPEADSTDGTTTFSESLQGVDDLLLAGEAVYAEMQQELELADKELEEEYGQQLEELLSHFFDQELDEGDDEDDDDEDEQLLDFLEKWQQPQAESEAEGRADEDAGFDSAEQPGREEAVAGTEPPLNILCIDGGGIKGLVPALIIQKLQEKYFAGQKISEVFDLVCGTSTGGIIALGTCVAKRDIEEMVDVYRNSAKKIFDAQTSKYKFQWASLAGGAALAGGAVAATVPHLAAAHLATTVAASVGASAGAGGNVVATIVGLTNMPARFKADGLKKILQDYTELGAEVVLDDTSGSVHHQYQRLDSPCGPGRTPKVFVVAAKKTSKGEKGEKILGAKVLRRYILKNYPEKGEYDGTRECHVWEAGAATGAGPTIFEAMQIEIQGQEETFVDGGVVANNP